MSQLTTVTEEQSGADEVPNNPAGRVLWFLERLLAGSRSQQITAVAAEIIGVPNDSPKLYLHLAKMRLQTLDVLAEMEQYHVGAPGFDAAFEAYDEILTASRMWQHPMSHTIESLNNSVSRAGMNSLRYANEVLKRSSKEKRLTDAQHRQYLDDIRGLIEDVFADDTLLPQEKQRIVGLLRQVEDALVNIRLYGADRVEDAVASVIGVVETNPSLRERLAKSKSFQRFVGALGALVIGLTQHAGQLAIERAFGIEDKPQIEVAQQDQNKQRIDQQLAGQPTRR
jgi:hypothetical protein